MNFIERQQCPVCHTPAPQLPLLRQALHTPEFQAYLERYYGGAIPAGALDSGEYILAGCERCGLIWQVQILDDAGMDQLYEVWIDASKSLAKKQREELHSRLGYSRQCVQVLQTTGKNAAETRVLDFGMGWGNWLLMARAFGFQAEGLETSPSRIAYVQALGLKVVQPSEIAPNSYAFVNAEQVFEHLSDPTGVIQACHEWLMPGGVLRIAVPDGSKVRDRLTRSGWSITDMATRPLEHINVFTPQSLHMLATQNGFQPFSPATVMPAIRLQPGDLKRFVQVLGHQLLSRAGLIKSTTVWLRKR